MTDAQAWLHESARQLAALLSGEGRTDEPLIQRWLERHPSFVPGARGPAGMSGRHPWPCALITQPPLSGIVAKVPDFCWLAADSADLTAMLIEIETPAKSWQQDRKAVQSAPLTQAREQIAAWRAWFSEASNQVRFLDEYLVPQRLPRPPLSPALRLGPRIPQRVSARSSPDASASGRHERPG